MSYSSLFQYYGNSKTKTPTVVFDFKVYARDIEARAKSIKKHLGGFESIESMRNFMKACWAYQLNRGCDALELHTTPSGFTAIVIDDVKGKVPADSTDNEESLGYWRNIVGHRKGLLPYKGGRKPKDEIMLLAMETGYEYIEGRGDIPFISEELFEADDLAGELCRLKRKGIAADKMLYLSTLDGDWQVLVDAEPNENGFNDDSPNIVWVNTRHFNDRVRGNPEVLDYYRRKEGVNLKHPSQVSMLKNIKGDAGDNLDRGSGLRLFDLLQEDVEFQLKKKTKALLKDSLKYSDNTVRIDHFEKASDYLVYNAFALPETPNPTPLLYDRWRDKTHTPAHSCLDFSELYHVNQDLFTHSAVH